MKNFLVRLLIAGFVALTTISIISFILLCFTLLHDSAAEAGLEFAAVLILCSFVWLIGIMSAITIFMVDLNFNKRIR